MPGPARRPSVLVAVAALVVVVGWVGAWATHRLTGDRRPVDRNGWHLAWSDEFDAAGLDPHRWAVEDRSTFGDGNGELACLMNRQTNVAVAGGVLRLTARRESPALRCGDADGRFPDGRPYSSAMVSTRGLADWTYGRFEIRARMPIEPGVSAGLWPAFWMRPSDNGDGELDVVEAIGSGRAGTAEAGIHHSIWDDYTDRQPHQTVRAAVPDGAASDGMHVYAVEWRPGDLRWFVDGVQTYHRDTTTTPWLPRVFGRPFFLRLNLAVGGTWPGTPTDTTRLPSSYEIDYVRVYQPDGAQGARDG